MSMRLSYLLLAKDRPETVRGTIARIEQITRLPREQWEIQLVDNGICEQNLKTIREQFPGVRMIHGSRRGRAPTLSQAITACTGTYIMPLFDDICPESTSALASFVKHIHADREIGAVAGTVNLPDGSTQGPALPSLVKLGATCFRKSVFDRIGKIPALAGSALDYFLSFKILAGGLRIDRREDILFQSSAELAIEASDDDSIDLENLPDAGEMVDLLMLARRYLPEKLAGIYWRDWSMKYRALAARAKRRKSAELAMFRARVRSLVGGHEPMSSDVIESVFGFRQQAASIGDWARRSSVWRIVLANFSDNIWAVYNACRSSGLQMRCIADSNRAFEDLKYFDLPIVPASRAFEGGGIDGVIVTASDSSQIESTFRSVRAHFHGPILKLWQTPRAATHAQALAA
jgi:hypothetical protein